MHWWLCGLRSRRNNLTMGRIPNRQWNSIRVNISFAATHGQSNHQEPATDWFWNGHQVGLAECRHLNRIAAQFFKTPFADKGVGCERIEAGSIKWRCQTIDSPRLTGRQSKIVRVPIRIDHPHSPIELPTDRIIDSIFRFDSINAIQFRWMVNSAYCWKDWQCCTTGCARIRKYLPPFPPRC